MFFAYVILQVMGILALVWAAVVSESVFGSSLKGPNYGGLDRAKWKA